ncbi:FAD-dependent oxidoreductase [Amphritea balenae]|uniref:FAD-dependent oxidoreductase n=1 Tax=Amphritea balenae TaxID=452629 RepID=A0A3P1SPD8_9GAMM|nr:FAD-dependent oxidoreductase [Amphritea balenae]RRC98993.1 FAD-dependent oxidoreductase [Amphritea balenae]GGK63508.1 amine oxidase [Amphritea balenae]
MSSLPQIAVLGAGPAGLMAAWELRRVGYPVVLIEAGNQVGGLSATHKFEGAEGSYRFDYGGHRFITRNPELLTFVEELMGDELLHSQRKSVIRFQGRTYQYPLAFGDLLKNAPLSLLAGASKDLLFQLPFTTPVQDRNNASFEQWIESRFGKTLYQHFFAGYTEKLWGINPSELSADWAAQRISLLDLKDVAKRLLPSRSGTPRTYARNYRYPKLGFGRIFERLAESLQAEGLDLLLNTAATGVRLEQGKIVAVKCKSKDAAEAEQEIPVGHVISTLPLPTMATFLGEQHQLKFRALRFFNMPMATENISDNTWQYLSDPDIMATRLQEPRRRSPFMSPPGQSSVMLEIPCFKGDQRWSMPDEELFPLVCNDLKRLGVDPALATGEFFSVRAEHAYPLLRVGYQQERQRLIERLNRVPNLTMTGRQGTFRYIFTDTAMEMGQLAARSLIEGQDRRAEIFDFRNEATVIETQSVA